MIQSHVIVVAGGVYDEVRKIECKFGHKNYKAALLDFLILFVIYKNHFFLVKNG
jgi:hypothetical protein